MNKVIFVWAKQIRKWSELSLYIWKQTYYNELLDRNQIVNYFLKYFSQAFTCSKLTTEAPEEIVKYAQS